MPSRFRPVLCCDVMSDDYTFISNVFELLKPLSHRRTDVPHGQYVGNGEVAHDSASNHATSFVGSMNHGRHINCHSTGPRQRVQLCPEPTNHKRHIETENESKRDSVTGIIAEFSHILEPSTSSTQTKQQTCPTSS